MSTSIASTVSQFLLAATHYIAMSGAQRTPKRANTSDAAGRPNKRAHTEATSGAAAGGAASSSSSASNATTSALMEGIDPSWNPMYAPLPAALRPESDHTAAAASSSAIATAASSVGGGYIPSLLCALMPSPAVFESNFNSKIKDKHLMLDNSASAAKGNINLGDAGAKLAKKRRKKRGIQMMSSNQRKEKGMAHIPRDNIKYEMFEPLHELWVMYMQDLLDPVNARGLSVGERVLKADYHGAIFTVIRSRSPTHVGQRGILIQETQETFVIVSATNAVKVLPKRDTIFSFSLPNANGQPNAPPQVFELYGDHLCFRSYERSARKFKAKATIEL